MASLLKRKRDSADETMRRESGKKARPIERAMGRAKSLAERLPAGRLWLHAVDVPRSATALGHDSPSQLPPGKARVSPRDWKSPHNSQSSTRVLSSPFSVKSPSQLNQQPSEHINQSTSLATETSKKSITSFFRSSRASQTMAPRKTSGQGQQTRLSAASFGASRVVPDIASMDGPAELPLHKKKPAAKPAAKQMRRPSLRKSGSLQSKGRQSTSDAKLIDLDEDDDGIVSDGPDDGDDDAASDVFKPEDIESSSEDDEASVHGTDEDVDTEADEASDEDHALEARSRKSEKGQKRPERSSKGGRKPAKRPRIAMSEDDEGDGDDEELIMSKAKAPAKSKTPGAANKKAYTDTWKYKPGLAEELPPISDVSEIADDMTRKALANGFQKVLDHIGSRKLRVATMCSGTESPILAIQLISDSLKKLFGQDFEYDHLFSAEIVPFKQAYIERNFQPPIMFRDIKELLAGDKATTAYGAQVPVPGAVDILIAGFSCVDFSNLNTNKPYEGDPGESSDTFGAILHYAKVWQPAIIILENVFTAPWERIKAAWSKDGNNYWCEYAKLDTKEYYVPQTRQRGYAVCINKDKMPTGGAAVSEWRDMMKDFKRPVSSPVEAFILPEDDPRIIRARVDLVRGTRGDEKSARVVDWTRCQGRHQDYRRDIQLGNKRPFSSWEDGGGCKCPDYTWHEWNGVQVERIWDTLDCSLLRCAKRGFDMQYKSRVLELSQNIDRFTDTTPSGIAGCVTPTGSPYLTIRGGSIIGLESLSLQGLPIERLLLTRETQAQLQDLAGNAMSTTVVGSAILSALLAGYKALPRGSSNGVKRIEAPDVSCNSTETNELEARSMNLGEYTSTAAKTLLDLASHSIRKCLCEGRDARTLDKILECRQCGHTACAKCAGKPKHDYAPMSLQDQKDRLAPLDFEARIKLAIPMRLQISGLSVSEIEASKNDAGVSVSDKDWKILIAAIEATLGQELRYHSLRRSHSWTATYDSPHARLELELRAGYAEWRLYGKPAKTDALSSRVRSLLKHPFARMRPKGDDLCSGLWEICLPTQLKFDIRIEGNGELQDSWEARLGLMERRFADKKVWSQLRFKLDDEVRQKLDIDISGNYRHLLDCGAACDSLHKKIDTSAEAGQEVFLFLDPTLYGDPKDDQFVFSIDHSRQGYGDTRPVICRVDASWRPSEGDKSRKVTGRLDGQWIKYPAARIQPLVDVAPVTIRTPSRGISIGTSHAACASATTVLYCEVPLTIEETVGWKQGPWQELNQSDTRTVFASFAWLTERVRDLKGLENWTVAQQPADTTICQKCSPKMPEIRWMVLKQKWIPYEDPQQAAPYERALKDRPQAFVTQMRIDDSNNGHLRIGLNPITLCHRALAKLPTNEAYSGTTVQWRLTPNFISDQRLSRPKFSLKSNKHDPPGQQPPNFKLKLRPEQMRSLAWMLTQDAETAPAFQEEEIEEAVLPQLGWRAEGRAETTIRVMGGVLADQVGYGKTATTLGLIDSTQAAANKFADEETPGRISVKATLVLAPDTICKQWESEVAKFCGSRYKVLAILTVAQLEKLSIRDIQNADIIIVNWKLLFTDGYLIDLARFAALPPMPNTKGRAFDAWLTSALTRIAEHIDQLRSEGSGALHDMQKAKLESFIADETSTRFIPSKRYRGAAYRKRESDKKLDGEQPEEEATAGANKRKKGAKKPADAEYDVLQEKDLKEYRGKDPFKLNSSVVKKRWQDMTTPLLQLFRFNRLVVDEYTYIQGSPHACVLSLSARSRWVLSGTPPLGDFADIKTIAVFIGLHLGIDDDSVGAISGHNIKALQKDRTAAEQFQSFRQDRSSAWHDSRHRTAQRFLDQFVRQNVAEIDEIPFEEKIHGVKLPAAERAIYMELEHFLRSQDMRIRKGRSRVENDRDRRLKEALDGAKTAEEALIKKCSHFTLEDLDGGMDEGSDPCDVVIAARTAQLAELRIDLENNLNLAVALKRRAKGEDSHYASWIQNINQGTIGDAEATTELLSAVAKADRDWTNKPVIVFKGTKSKARAGLATTKAAKLKLGKKQTKKDAADSDEDEEDDVEDEDEDSGPYKERLPAEAETCAERLRNYTNNLRRLATELVNRHRSLRFFNAIRAVQAASALANSNSTCDVCRSESVPVEDLFMLTLCGHTKCRACCQASSSSSSSARRTDISSSRKSSSKDIAGDSGRADYSSSSSSQSHGNGNGNGTDHGPKPTEDIAATACAVPACTAATSNWHAVPATSLLGSKPATGSASTKSTAKATVPAPAPAGPPRFGQKLEDLVALVRDRIPADEQVLLFVQYEELMGCVSAALEGAGVRHYVIHSSNNVNTAGTSAASRGKGKGKAAQAGKGRSSGARASETMTAFQTERDPLTRAKVLVLNLADESAAGANLTNANHVLFLSPLLAESGYRYESSMAQAVGRARRYGQRRCVVVQRFFAVGTVDERVLREREGRVLVQVEDEDEDGQGGGWRAERAREGLEGMDGMDLD